MFYSKDNRKRIIPRDIHLSLLNDGDFYFFNHPVESITIPKSLMGMGNKNDDGEDYVAAEDQDYIAIEDTDEDKGEDDEDDGDQTNPRWVGDNDRFNAFLYWLSGNECSDEDKEEIISSFNLLCGCFTAEDLLTNVRGSGLYSIENIVDNVLKIISSAKRQIKISENCKGNEFCYLEMLVETCDEWEGYVKTYGTYSTYACCKGSSPCPHRL